jgi:hypothetical protein
MKWILLTIVFIGNQPPTVTQVSFQTEQLCEKARSDLSKGLPKGSEWNSVRIGGPCLKVAD